MNSTPPSVSFIAITDFSARWKYLTESVSDLLGWEPSDLRERSFFELVHPDELAQVQELHYETIRSDKAAAMAYMRLKHKDAHKGYLLCAVSLIPSSRTVVYDRVVGSVSFASPGGEALHYSSTAQEITVITPAASNFEFRRWHDPPPPRPKISPCPSRTSPPWRTLTPPADLPTTQSLRTALVLDRFSINCTITHYSNHQLIAPAAATPLRPRPFFDFVVREDEAVVRSWLATIKTWGVNERGHPSSGGFGYGRFLLCAEGRDSIASQPPPPATGWRRSFNRAASPLADNHLSVDAIFSAHSDGLVCILRRAQ
ncbi:hypothetical protein C8F04DRAFT_1221517 [Mycena alexandri]|uniref:PAS domain-containing protein n=1 Tax=Mycena alexandri TaxID=1745969 RepID=A0AAD6SWI7_9AGAR|nr:hypothetical protein C8F04DRAFT_1221517 [Mycena alexandri]